MSSGRILLIDDDESIRKVIGYMLEEAGYDVETCASAEAGARAFSERRPDLVLSDIKMPKKDGIELLGDLKAIDASVPVIILTAFGTVETAVEAMKRGAAISQSRSRRDLFGGPD
jgi:DNA-binding NtrC family response regulator